MLVQRKPLSLSLVGKNGNAFVLMGHFRAQAEREGWTEDEIQAVLDDATSGNYDHLLCVLMKHTTGEDSDEE